jgi:hypothetical protein
MTIRRAEHTGDLAPECLDHSFHFAIICHEESCYSVCRDRVAIVCHVFEETVIRFSVRHEPVATVLFGLACCIHCLLSLRATL